MKTPKVEQIYLTPRKWVRGQKKRRSTQYIDIHDPGSTASVDGLFKYLEKDAVRYGSYNTIFGGGRIIEIIPEDEVSYSNGHLDHLTGYFKKRFPELSKNGLQNWDSLSLCCCRIDNFGTILAEDWKNLVWYTKTKLVKYGLKSSDVIPHYNITTRKVDPLLFWNDRSELDRFRWEVDQMKV
jgi:N-acetylmuramoyl-L-alanine amidase CwlA